MEVESVTVKVVVCGETGVGKTCILKRLATQSYNSNERSTIGVDFVIRSFDSRESNRRFKLQLWDTCGQERFRALVQSYFKGAHVLVFVFDLCKKESFHAIESYWREHAFWKRNEFGVYGSTITTGALAFLVGNKSDRAEFREVTDEEAILYARARGMQYFETSAKTGAHVDEEFYNIVSTLDLYDKQLVIDNNNGSAVFTNKEFVPLNAELHDDDDLAEGLVVEKQNITKARRCCF